jgi:hypothetical protein
VANRCPPSSDWFRTEDYFAFNLKRPLAEDTMMTIFVRGKSCPQCRNIARHRIRRSFWMRLLPGSRHYLCENCEAKFMSVFKVFSVHWPFESLA